VRRWILRVHRDSDFWVRPDNTRAQIRRFLRESLDIALA
jgi:hypothetical protein